MDVNEKRKALHSISCEGVFCNNCDYYREGECGIYVAPDEQIEIWYAKAFPETATPCTGSMDHEAEYNNLIAKCEELVLKIDQMQSTYEKLLYEYEKEKAEHLFCEDRYKEAAADAITMKKQLDIVYLIFGGRK